MDDFASHVRSRPSFWVWFNYHQSNAHPAESDTHSHTHTTHKQTKTATRSQNAQKNIYKSDLLWYSQSTQTVRRTQLCTRAVPHLQSWEGHLFGPERACVDALMFMFWRLAMMKESLFKSGLEGPPLNAPPFSPYNCTHALPGSYARTCETHVKVCSQIKAYTCRNICDFVLNPWSLDWMAKIPLWICK